MLNVTQGDNIVFQLTATDGCNKPIDLTGATFTSYLRGTDGAILEYPNSQHTADPDQIGKKGQFTLTIPPDQSDDIPYNSPDAPKSLVTKIVKAGLPIFYQGIGILNMQPNFPLT